MLGNGMPNSLFQYLICKLFSMKKVLVTGATGFIGNYVIEDLLERDCEIIATSPRHDKAFSKKWFDNVRYVPFNLEEFNENVNYYNYFFQPDLLIHLAWEGLPNYKERFHVDLNFPRHYKFLSNLIRFGLKDLTVTGTCLEYGMQEGKLSEELKPVPTNSYSIAKNLLREKIEMLNKEFNFSFKWVRLFYTYGKGQNSNSILSQLERALENGDVEFNMSGGEQLRDYLPVETLARYIVEVALQKKVTGIINCCSGHPISVKELVRTYLSNHNAEIKLNLGYYPYTDYEPMSFWGDNTKLKSILKNE